LGLRPQCRPAPVSRRLDDLPNGRLGARAKLGLAAVTTTIASVEFLS
jgi:hypothetical protein